jgi:DNA-binding NarL/FixJ family response regulator
MAALPSDPRRVSATRLEQPALRRRVVAVLAAQPGVVFDDRAAEVEIVGSGNDAIRAAAAKGALVVAVLPAPDRRAATQALDAGASGVVAEAEVERSLPAALRAVCDGLIVVPQASRHAVRRPVLSSREKQILSMVVVGRSNGEIASSLQLAESTVKSHLSAILSKLGVRSRKEAADLVLDPRSGLGEILPITPPARSAAYARPTVM